MAADPVQANIGTGSTVAFGTSSWVSEIISLAWSGMTRGVVETSHMTTSLTGTDEFGSATFIAHDFADGGELTLEVHFNPDWTPPIELVEEVITITTPINTVGGTGATWVFTGFCKSFEWNAPMEDKMTATLVLRINGKVDITASTDGV